MMEKNRAVEILWSPRDPEKKAIAQYRRHINQKFDVDLQDSQQLQRWSVQHPQGKY